MLTHFSLRANQMKKPMYKKTQNFLFGITIAIIITTNFNCISSMIKNEMKQTPGDYRLLVHANPKEGDYSVYKSISEYGTWLTYCFSSDESGILG